ncbi:MAG: ankyrin repeat domain-containing protein, partial [Caldilinea sp.]|nr:ankyrin repeat domain-containing protein [Caldilinea sp.]
EARLTTTVVVMIVGALALAMLATRKSQLPKWFRWDWLHTTGIRVMLRVYRDINLRDKHGDTALMRAVGLGSTELVRELLEKRADVNVQNHFGFTALMSAAGSDHCNRRKIAKVLLDHDADPTIRNIYGIDATMIASSHGNYEVVEQIKHGQMIHGMLNP